MKSVLLSIKPKYCELIAGGIKTIEVRKTKPKLDTPFKCYIYCTKDKSKNLQLQGKVIGEFVCDEIFPIRVFENGTIQDYMFRSMKKSCVPYDDIVNYIGNGCIGYGWHISNLKIYDTPKELSRFIPNCTELQNGECMDFKNTSCVCQEKDYNPDGMVNVCKCINRMYRPPQSWCYVEEVTE